MSPSVPNDGIISMDRYAIDEIQPLEGGEVGGGGGGGGGADIRNYSCR